MKKIIWIYGQPGAGRKTLIENIKNDTNEVKKTLGIEGANLAILDIPYDRESSYSDFSKTKEREKNIHGSVKSFVTSNYDVLIIPGEFSDYDSPNTPVMKQISEDYPDLEKEIVLLNPSDINVFYERLKNTEWFKSNEKDHLRKYPKEWLNFVIKYMRDHLQEYEEDGYTFYEMDTLDGYSINKPKQIVK